jgi:hypothetical protein
MRSTYDFGSTTPPMEDCAQVGSRAYDYLDQARKEAKAYIAQIRRVLGREPDGARLTTKSHPHDFGTYLTCVLHYSDDDPEAVAYADRCDTCGIGHWDEEARAELGLTD